MHDILVTQLHASVQSINHAKQQQMYTYLTAEVTSAGLISNREILRSLLAAKPRVNDTTSSSYMSLFFALTNSMSTQPDIISVKAYYPDWTLLVGTNATEDVYDFTNYTIQRKASDGTAISTYYNGTHLFLQVCADFCVAREFLHLIGNSCGSCQSPERKEPI